MSLLLLTHTKNGISNLVNHVNINPESQTKSSLPEFQ